MGQIFSIVLAAVLMGCATTPKVDKGKATLHHQLGLSSLAQFDFTSALAELMRAAEYDSQDPEIQHALGLAYHGKGRAQLALEAYQAAVKLKPDFSAAYNNMGIVYLSIKRYDKAREAFQNALENILYPHPENAYLNLGLLALEEGQYEDALRSFTRAKKAAPRFCGAYYFSAKALEKQKRINLALENVNLAVKFCPDFAEAYRFGGVLWLMKKRRETARKYFAKAYEIDPESDVGRESKRYLKLLKKRKRK